MGSLIDNQEDRIMREEKKDYPEWQDLLNFIPLAIIMIVLTILIMCL